MVNPPWAATYNGERAHLGTILAFAVCVTPLVIGRLYLVVLAFRGQSLKFM